MEYTHEKPELLSRYTTLGGGQGYNANTFEQDKSTHGAGWPTGNRVHEGDADAVVETFPQLKTAVQDASDGDLIYVPGDAHMSITDAELTVDTPNVTIASGRGYDGDGALVEASADPDPFLRFTAPGCRLTGIRFNFPVTERIEWPGYNADKVSKAVVVDADRCEIDNCVFRGCGHAGVGVGFATKVRGTHVHHNDMVDNPMGGLGYGVTVRSAEPLIQYNYFNNNRHSIAADGSIECYYVARYNFQGPESRSHVFDMHEHNLSSSDIDSLKSKYDDFDQRGLSEGDLVAGRRFSVHHNICMHTDHEALKVRAEPLEGGQVNKNWFFHERSPRGVGSSGDSVRVTHTNARDFDEVGINIESNVYGQGGPDDVGIPSDAVPDEVRRQLEQQKEALGELERELNERERQLEERAEEVEEKSTTISKFTELMKKITGY